MRAKINALDARLPVRYELLILCAFGVLLTLFSLFVFNLETSALRTRLSRNGLLGRV